MSIHFHWFNRSNRRPMNISMRFLCYIHWSRNDNKKTLARERYFKNYRIYIMAQWNSPCPFPIGSIFITTSPTNPTNTRPDSFRVPFGKGKTIVCVDDEEKDKNLAWIKEAEWTNVTPTNKRQYHTHSIAQWSVGAPCESWSMTWVTTNVTWSASSFQPSIACYIRKRVEESEVESFNPFNLPTETEEQMKVAYGDNVIIDYNTLKPKQPNPYRQS